MKIAVSGTHFSGKTTLGHTLAERLQGFAFVDEPYHLLSQDGYEFADVPTVDDFFEQLQLSVSSMSDSSADAIFDRCPLDFIAYASSLEDGDPFDVRQWVRLAREGLKGLDVIVFCQIESPDRIPTPASEDRKLRKAVDLRLKDLVLDDSYGVLSGIQVIEVSGTAEDRVRQVLAELQKAR